MRAKHAPDRALSVTALGNTPHHHRLAEGMSVALILSLSLSAIMQREECLFAQSSNSIDTDARIFVPMPGWNPKSTQSGARSRAKQGVTTDPTSRTPCRSAPACGWPKDSSGGDFDFRTWRSCKVYTPQKNIRIFAYLSDFCSASHHPQTLHTAYHHGLSRSPRLTPQARSTRCRTRVRPYVTRVPRCGEWDRVDLRPTLFGSVSFDDLSFFSLHEYSRCLSCRPAAPPRSCVCCHPLSPSSKRRR
jgi:hypothetical protein